MASNAAHADIHAPDGPSHTPPPGEKTVAKNETQAKQGTDAPKGMPVVLIASTVGAAVALFVIYTVFFG